MEGTYPLPEAQLDRFMFNVSIDYLSEDDEVAVVRQTTTTEPEPISHVFSGEDLLRFHDVVRQVPIAEDVVRYAVRLAAASRPHPGNPLGFINEWVTWGAGLRASQYMVLGAKARALLYGRSHVSFEDIQALAASGAAAPHPDQLPGRGRGRDRRRPHRPPAQIREGERDEVRDEANPSQWQTAGGMIDPAALMKIKSMELRAKAVVEGFWKGIHRSPYHGFSVEFTEYRQYTPGDDPRYIDWRVFARSDRYYIKKFEDETNLRCHLLIDHSRSMGYGSGGYTKAQYAGTLAATLAYFLFTQGDAVGLATFDDQIREYMPPRNRPSYLRRLMLALEAQPRGKATDLGAPLQRIARDADQAGHDRADLRPADLDRPARTRPGLSLRRRPRRRRVSRPGPGGAELRFRHAGPVPGRGDRARHVRRSLRRPEEL